MIGKFTFVPSGLAVSNLDNIWVELLGFHRFICFKIEKAKLYAIKQFITFNDTTTITALIYNHLIFIARQHFRLCAVPFWIKIGPPHYHHSAKLVLSCPVLW